MVLGVYGSVERQLCRYGINSSLPRAYGIFAGAESDGGILFPFQVIRRGRVGQGGIPVCVRLREAKGEGVR